MIMYLAMGQDSSYRCNSTLHPCTLRRPQLVASRLGVSVYRYTSRAPGIVELDEAIASTAAGIDPPQLRSLDAIHLAAALAIGDDLEAFICYDARLADAARAAGLTVVVPA
jgi:predicted nucleic acid-binding protein